MLAFLLVPFDICSYLKVCFYLFINVWQNEPTTYHDIIQGWEGNWGWRCEFWTKFETLDESSTKLIGNSKKFKQLYIHYEIQCFYLHNKVCSISI
jgi:hypothetical protein